MAQTFIFNKYVTGKNYFGRKTESQVFVNLITQGNNVCIYEPPKAGKTSLIQQSFFNMRVTGQKFISVNFSLLNVRTEADLMMRLGSEILKSVGSTPADFAQAVERHLSGTNFIFDPAAYQTNGSVLSLSWDIDDSDIRAIFALPYRVAEEKGQKMFVVLDEFQNIMLCGDGSHLCKLFEEVLRPLSQEQRSLASYIFVGSQVNAMKDIFEHHRYFSRLAERLEIGPFDSKEIIDNVVKGFLATGKVMDRDLLQGACNLFRNNMWYINHFASICDSMSKGYIMEPVLQEALDCMLAIHESRFVATMNDLTTYQVCLLRAIIDGHTKFSSSEVIRKYELSSSANVRRLKDALCKKEIVTFDKDDNATILDPLFEYWVKKYFFEIRSE